MANIKRRKRIGRMATSFGSAMATLGFFIAVACGPQPIDGTVSNLPAVVAIASTAVDPLSSTATLIADPAVSGTQSAAAPVSNVQTVTTLIANATSQSAQLSSTTSPSSSSSTTTSSTSAARLRTRGS
ncbi:MAG: hypothetical protein QOF51_2848 [Chloroflexota bacterium]|nr:hypothetical protein [Chloroflexota bacterium]